MNVLGLDVGGANIKAVYLKTKNSNIVESRVKVEYFPIWKMGKDRLLPTIQKTVFGLIGKQKPDNVGVTMTAEVSDVYFSKVEGVSHVLSVIEKIFPRNIIHVLDFEGKLLPVGKAKKSPYRVASANWMATGWLVSRQIKNCLIVDVGSTTTSLIPIVDGKVAVKGKTDLEKLLCGELVYTGALRTNLAAITSKVPVKNGYASVSSEFFAASGDVHLILGNLGKKDYTTETADGRGKTVREAMARIARIVCADLNMLNKKEIIKICEYVYKKQLEQIIQAIRRVLGRLKQEAGKEKLPVVVTGMGKKFLAEEAAKRVGVRRIIDLEKIVCWEASLCTPAYGLALMVLEKFRK